MCKSSRQSCSLKKVFLEISQKSQGNTCIEVSILVKLQGSGLKLYLKSHFNISVFLIIFWNFYGRLFYRTPPESYGKTWFTSSELGVESLKARVKTPKCKSKFTSYEFKFTSYEFRSRSYEFQCLSYKLKSRSYESNARVQFYELLVPIHKFKNHQISENSNKQP